MMAANCPAALGVMAALTIAACGADRAGEVTASGSYWQGDLNYGPDDYSDYIVLVVDDADSVDAALLREQVVRSLQYALQSEIDQLHGEYPDPASWHPTDLSVLIARPSASDATALVTPVSQPGLAWKSNQASEIEANAVAQNVSLLFASSVADASKPFRPLHAAKRAVELVLGARPPENDEEAKFQLGITQVPFVRLLIAATRPSEDIGALADFDFRELLINPSDPSVVYARVVAPAISGEPCDKYSWAEIDWSAPLSLENWALASSSPFVGWPCPSDPTVYRNLLVDGIADWQYWCGVPRITRLASGQMPCQISIDQSDLEQCDPARGWRDPPEAARHPDHAMLVDYYGKTLRRCEIAQLEGPSLDACRTTLECEGCPSGFCGAEVPELLDSMYCTDPQFTLIRFVGGAGAGAGGLMHVRCLSEDRE